MTNNYAPPLADSRVVSPVKYSRTTNTADARRSEPPATGPTYFLVTFHNAFDTTLTEMRTDKCLAATSSIADHVIEIDLLIRDEHDKRLRLATLLYLIQASARECFLGFPYTLAFFAHGTEMHARLCKLHQQLKMFWMECKFFGPDDFADVLRVNMSDSRDQRPLACSDSTIHDDQRTKRDYSLQEMLDRMDDFLVPNQPLNFTRVQWFDLYICPKNASLAISEQIPVGPLPPESSSDELPLPPICWTGTTSYRDDGSETYRAKLKPFQSSSICTAPSAVLPVEALQNPEIYKGLRERTLRWARGEQTPQHDMYRLRLWASMASSLAKLKLKELHIALYELRIRLSSALCGREMHPGSQSDLRIFQVIQGKIEGWNAQDEMLRLAEIEREEARRRSRQQELPHATAKSGRAPVMPIMSDRNSCLAAAENGSPPSFTGPQRHLQRHRRVSRGALPPGMPTPQYSPSASARDRCAPREKSLIRTDFALRR